MRAAREVSGGLPILCLRRRPVGDRWSRSDVVEGLPIRDYAVVRFYRLVRETGSRLPLHFVGVDGLIESSKRQLPAAAEGELVA